MKEVLAGRPVYRYIEKGHRQGEKGKTLSEQARSPVRKEGVSAETLLNLWVQEKLRQVGRAE